MDGEAWFGLSKSPITKGRSRKHSHQWIPIITVTQKHRGVLDYIVNEVGYGRVQHNRSDNSHLLHFSQKKARLILPKIIPYLTVKKHKAELLQEACRIIKTGSKWGSFGRPEHEFKTLEDLQQLIRDTKNDYPQEIKNQEINQKKLF